MVAISLALHSAEAPCMTTNSMDVKGETIC
jgi:hypothetical protein